VSTKNELAGTIGDFDEPGPGKGCRMYTIGRGWDLQGKQKTLVFEREGLYHGPRKACDGAGAWLTIAAPVGLSRFTQAEA
jgi:hypothetical protein